MPNLSLRRLDGVTPIRFKSVKEDATSIDETGLEEQASVDGHTSKSAAPLEPNFTFEHSYPAVVFEKVTFAVDKSQQQSNFLNECQYRLKHFLNLSSEDDGAQRTVNILKSVDLNVPHGSIFGLLGPSSCGKTTLLRCLVGLLKPTSGNIRLFCRDSSLYDRDCDASCCSKRRRHPKSCKVPGANVGYMPQDLGLYNDFSIRQFLTMFGRYMRMKPELIESRIKFMTEFLDLPDVDRVVGSLSGGQQRRVSFAVACLHMPPLIILDEPTVGVDPLLRKNIWKYLRHLASKENRTIIITTHYIEEASQADQVALMRAGEILIQDSPARIVAMHGCKTLEEAFLKICSNIEQVLDGPSPRQKLYPQPKFDWNSELDINLDSCRSNKTADPDKIMAVTQMKNCNVSSPPPDESINERKPKNQYPNEIYDVRLAEEDKKFSLEPNIIFKQPFHVESREPNRPSTRKPIQNRLLLPNSKKLVISGDSWSNSDAKGYKRCGGRSIFDRRHYRSMSKMVTLMMALIYKNYRRNFNSVPLMAFQFLLPIIQMVSFSLCVGGRPSDIGLGIVNHDKPFSIESSPDILIYGNRTSNSSHDSSLLEDVNPDDDLLSLKYISLLDHTLLNIRAYNSIEEALIDVRKARLWAAMEISENFSTALQQRFDLDNFYQLNSLTIDQSTIRLYPDQSNKVLDMICRRSLITSYRMFLSENFDQFKRLPVEIKSVIFSIKPNLISNSIDGYTESIAAGLLASLTYIMAAGLTTFIMVVERSQGILERTYTCGINPVVYLLAHAIFRSLVMMLQIALVLFLTFYILQQPLEGSLWLAYSMLMTLNITGISYGLLISSLVSDQNGAALTIVSSLVVKITLSGILWPLEAVPQWLRTICYIQPLMLPVKALKAITLKGSGLGDKTVQLGFLISTAWLFVFLLIATKRFKFYQH